MPDLNSSQAEAVNTLTGPVMILAGAGTGKTRTVTYRIANMIRLGTPAAEILAVTFTNKAAAEMRERLGQLVSKDDAADATVCTFHSLCVRILREHIEHFENLPYKKNFAIFAGSDQSGLLREIIIRKGGAKEKLKPFDVLSQISKAKSLGQPLSEIPDDFIADIAIAYQNELRAQNALDFDDLLILAERLLREYAAPRLACQNKWKHLTVDEFQDTNALQLALLRQLVPPPHNLCVVGDDDQSIYGWRGAEISNILDFEQHFPNPQIIRLEHNYRSTEAILSTANQLIKNNLGRREKELKHTINGGTPIRLIGMPGDDEEAELIADEIFDQKSTEKLPWEHFAVLFRTNQQIRKVEHALREKKVPYRLLGAQSFYDKKEIRDILSYMQIVASPTTDTPLLRVINTPPRGIGQKTILLATDHSRANHQSVWESLGSPDFQEQLSAKAQNAIKVFIDQVLEVRTRIFEDTQNPGVVINEWIGQMEYADYVTRLAKTDSERDQKREAIGSVIADLTNAHSTKNKTLQKFLDDVALASDKDDDDLEKKSGATLITLHASKGLEFPRVYLVGLEQGILPHKRSIDEGTLDEERRLLYVGITRAQDQLTLTHCHSRIKYGEEAHCEPSAFHPEILADNPHIEQIDYDEIMNSEASDASLDALFSGFLKD